MKISKNPLLLGKKRNKKTSDFYKTAREYLQADDFQKWVIDTPSSPFYFCHITMDWLEIRLTPPDAFAMTYETGLNLLGVNVALNTYINMLNAVGWSYYVPHYYYTWNIPEKYKTTQQVTFDALSRLIGLVAEDMYMAGYYLAKSAGGLGVYIPMVADWLEEVSKTEILALDVLNKLQRSREFTFIEWGENDPTYGRLMFNNLSYKSRNTNDNTDPGDFFDTNWNIFNPQRFEEQMLPYVEKVYDVSTPTSTIYEEQKVFAITTIQDSLAVNQRDTIFGQPTVDGYYGYSAVGVNFSFNISGDRKRTNMILTYSNKPKNCPTLDSTSAIWFIKGEDQIEQFFRAMSLFMQQPVITNYLLEYWRFETGQSSVMDTRLQPTKITPTRQGEFTSWIKNMYKYGKALQSGVPNLLTEKLANLTSMTAEGDINCSNP